VSYQITELDRQNWARVCQDQQRQDFLDSLYIQYGRDKKDHPMHSLYTGLFQQWVADGRPSDGAVRNGDVLGDLSPGSVSV
jgi:hypothetical protein